MSYVVELSQKLAALKTQIREILASHGIIVSATDSIDYYMEKLKTLKIINQDKKIFYGGNYKPEIGYSGFGDLEVDVADFQDYLVEVYSNLQSGTFLSELPKYNADDSEAEYIKNPYSGPSVWSRISENYTGSTINNIRFNNIKRWTTYNEFTFNYTGLKLIETINCPDLLFATRYNDDDSYRLFGGGDVTNDVALQQILLPELVIVDGYNGVCRNLKELTTLLTPKLRLVHGSIAYNCPKLENVDTSSLEIVKSPYYDYSSYYYINSLFDSALFSQIDLSKLKEVNLYYSYLLSRCQNLTMLKLPELEIVIGGYPLINDCKKLEIISVPKLKELSNVLFVNYGGGSSAVSSTTTNALTTIHFKDLQTISQSLTYDNTYLCFPNLNTIVLEGDQVTSLSNTTWFNGNSTSRPHFYNKTANIYVPDDIIDQYKEATNWTSLSTIIKPLSEYNDPYNIITRHNGYMNIDVVQNNCTVYINGIEKTTLTNLPFYPNKDYNITVMDSTNNRTHVETLNFSDITTKNITIDLTQKQFKSLTINTNVQDPDIELYYRDVLISTSNTINVSQNTEITYKIRKLMYRDSIGTIVVDQNKTINITLEETNVYIELEPGDTSWGWKIAEYTNPKASDGWIMYQSINPSSTTNYAIAKIHIKNLTSFTCYINSYAYNTYNYTIISNEDASSYPTTSTATTAKANTNGKQHIPTTFNTTNWTTVTYSGLSTAEHIIYVVYRRSRTTSGGYNAGFLLFDPEQ